MLLKITPNNVHAKLKIDMAWRLDEIQSPNSLYKKSWNVNICN